VSANSFIIIHTYACAFLFVGKKEGSLDVITSQVKKILEAASSDKKLTIILNNKTLSLEGKVSFLEKRLSQNLHHIIVNLIKTLKKNNRMGLFLGVLRSYLVLESIERGEKPIKFVTSCELSHSEKKELVDTFSTTFGKKIIPEFFVDSSILGGLKVYYDDKLIDKSWFYQFFILKQHMEGTPK